MTQPAITSQTWTIRPAEAHEAPILAGFLVQMAHDSEGLTLNPDTVRAGVQRVFDTPALGRYWMALDPADSDRQVGMCLVTPEWSDWHNRPYWWFQSVFIIPECRGQGVIQALMAAVEDDARRQGIQELRLYVETHNQRAIRAYDKLGYRQGQYAVMQKTLTPA